MIIEAGVAFEGGFTAPLPAPFSVLRAKPWAPKGQERKPPSPGAAGAWDAGRRGAALRAASPEPDRRSSCFTLAGQDYEVGDGLVAPRAASRRQGQGVGDSGRRTPDQGLSPARSRRRAEGEGSISSRPVLRARSKRPLLRSVSRRVWDRSINGGILTVDSKRCVQRLLHSLPTQVFTSIPW